MLRMLRTGLHHSPPFPDRARVASLHTDGHKRQRRRSQRLHESVGKRALLTKATCQPGRVDGACELQVSHESFGFSHNSPEERGREHDTSSLGARDPDKHVYALSSLISKLNKGCFRRGPFRWWIQLDETAIHLLRCCGSVGHGSSFF